MSPEVKMPGSLRETAQRLHITRVHLEWNALEVEDDVGASSTTPGIEENSCKTPSILTAVIAAPSMEESKARRRLLPMVVPKPRSNGCAEKRP
jgi:hypothetical protein